jgi:hypothetical protein
MLNFCTLFNSNYLVYGLTLYESLKKTTESFHLYIYAFDDLCYDYFRDKELPHITIIKLEDFEDEALLNIKSTRSFGEYCWTCTPSVIRHAINKFNLDICTYVDADLYFFSSPQPLLDELGDKSVLITEHRYYPRYDQSVESGIYCVQFMTFKNTDSGMEVLEWWRNACIDWCFNKFEDGKFGDQKYLDDWLDRFDTVHSLKHLGGGLAPWNVQNYKYEIGMDKIFVIENDNKFELVFYHFHDLKFFQSNVVRLTNEIYILPKLVIHHIYKSYLKIAFTILQQENKLSFFSNVPPNYFNKVGFLTLLTKLRFQYVIDVIRMKEFYRLFSKGNYYSFLKFK